MDLFRLVGWLPSKADKDASGYFDNVQWCSDWVVYQFEFLTLLPASNHRAARGFGRISAKPQDADTPMAFSPACMNL